MRIAVSVGLALLLVGGGLFLFWPGPQDPTLPDVGPGARRISGSARIDATPDEGP